jgi:peptidyl-prolyl cis-trans isomerase SurA
MPARSMGRVWSSTRRKRALSCLVALVCTAGLLAVRPARSAVVERVVAVVGEHAILLSDLRARARPFLLRIHREIPPGARRTAAISQMYKLLLGRMVEEQLQQRAANKLRIVVSPQEIDQAIGRIAAQNGLKPLQVVQEAARSGMNEAEYRREIRRQLLDAKMLNLRLQGRIRITPSDLKAAYTRIARDERKKLWFRAAWIVLDAPRNRRSASNRARALAEQLVAQARRGADFAELARAHSDDEQSRKHGGLLGKIRPGTLPHAVDIATMGLDVGEVSAPLRNGDQIVIVKLLERQESSLPSFEEAAEELHQRVYMEKMNKARRHWLEGLRRTTHVEVRL